MLHDRVVVVIHFFSIAVGTETMPFCFSLDGDFEIVLEPSGSCEGYQEERERPERTLRVCP